jgi:uncharacterized protein (DUF1499 family)
MSFSSARGKRPDNLGVKNGRLFPCPESPNCVSTQSAGGYPQAKPLPFIKDRATAHARILDIIASMPRASLITINDYYIHAEFRTRFLRLVDDVEFYFDQARQEIHYRAASRVGNHDLNANPKRMQAIRSAYEAVQ